MNISEKVNQEKLTKALQFEDWGKTSWGFLIFGVLAILGAIGEGKIAMGIFGGLAFYGVAVSIVYFQGNLGKQVGGSLAVFIILAGIGGAISGPSSTNNKAGSQGLNELDTEFMGKLQKIGKVQSFNKRGGDIYLDLKPTGENEIGAQRILSARGNYNLGRRFGKEISTVLVGINSLRQKIYSEHIKENLKPDAIHVSLISDADENFMTINYTDGLKRALENDATQKYFDYMEFKEDTELGAKLAEAIKKERQEQTERRASSRATEGSESQTKDEGRSSPSRDRSPPSVTHEFSSSSVGVAGSTSWFETDGPWRISYGYKGTAGTSFTIDVYNGEEEVIEHIQRSGPAASGVASIPKGGDYYLHVVGGSDSEWSIKIMQ